MDNLFLTKRPKKTSLHRFRKMAAVNKIYCELGTIYIIHEIHDSSSCIIALPDYLDFDLFFVIRCSDSAAVFVFRNGLKTTFSHSIIKGIFFLYII